jgi:predicted ATPase
LLTGWDWATGQAAVDTANRQKAKSFELRAAASLAHLWAEQGECRRAHDLLAPIYNWFTKDVDMPDRQEANALLNELASAPPGSRAGSRRPSLTSLNNPG